MNIFEINTNGAFSIKEKNKEFYKILGGGILFYFLLFFVFKYTIDNKVSRTFLIIYLTIVYFFLFIIIPISLKARINKVVKKIGIERNQILFFTAKEFRFNKNEIKFVEVKNKFSGFSINKKDGILLKTKAGKEYWIIEDFYNNYEELRQVLLG